MGIWGVEGGSLDDHIRHLGLRCYGENSSNEGFTYHVYNEDKSFDIQLSAKEWKNVENIYKEWKIKNRKDKLEKINTIS